MLKDNQLTTVLLLVALGFLIYYLTKPKSTSENFANEPDLTTTKESNTASIDPNLKSSILADSSNFELQKSDLPNFPLEKTELPNFPLQKTELPKIPLQKTELPKISLPKSDFAKTGTDLPTLSVVDDLKPEILSQILDETDPNFESNSEVQNQDISEINRPVFDFEPNDTWEVGADVNNAFTSPIPQQTRPDEVPINKNNLKKYDAKDFLPKEINSKWFDTDFSQAKYNVNDDKLINTERYVIGVNTVGQSLKNASYDIRGTIPNPKFTVSPWNNSTYEPDFNLRPLC